MILALTLLGAVWTLETSIGRVPRPVLTLALSGALSGAPLSILTLLLGDVPEPALGVVLVGALVETVRLATLGALAARGIQRALARS